MLIMSLPLKWKSSSFLLHALLWTLKLLYWTNLCLCFSQHHYSHGGNSNHLSAESKCSSVKLRLISQRFMVTWLVGGWGEGWEFGLFQTFHLSHLDKLFGHLKQEHAHKLRPLCPRTSERFVLLSDREGRRWDTSLSVSVSAFGDVRMSLHCFDLTPRGISISLNLTSSQAALLFDVLLSLCCL